MPFAIRVLKIHHFFASFVALLQPPPPPPPPPAEATPTSGVTRGILSRGHGSRGGTDERRAKNQSLIKSVLEQTRKVGEAKVPTVDGVLVSDFCN